MLAALLDVGIRIVSATKDSALCPCGSKKVRNITGTGGVASLTGMEIWELISSLPLIFCMTRGNKHTIISLGMTTVCQVLILGGGMS